MNECLNEVARFDRKIVQLLPLTSTNEEVEKQFNLAFLSNEEFFIKKGINISAEKGDVSENIWGVLGESIKPSLDAIFNGIRYAITINFSRLSSGRLAGFSMGFDLKNWERIDKILANKDYGFGKLFLSHSHDSTVPFIPACLFHYDSNSFDLVDHYDISFLSEVSNIDIVSVREYLEKSKENLRVTLQSSFELIDSQQGCGNCDQYVFYSPIVFDKNCRTGVQITCELMKNFGDFGGKIRAVINVIRPYLLAIERQLSVIETRNSFSEQATRTAIGSIMSRNGSHNIGSHVLSALSHNVGTMPDDRVLYQYIQHRMDYIATATTEFPQWTTPTMFVAGLMKNFYSQKHLLDYISRSEGLRAYKFQERNLDDAARMNQHGTIRVFLRRFYKLSEYKQDELPQEHRYLTYDLHGQAWSIYYFFGEKDKMFRRKFSDDKRTQYEVSESGGTAKFLDYAERFTPDWSQDVRIAIPGGIVGQHAFYTIIENVIRNAAKHGWAAKENLSEKDLEVYIDFRDDKSKGEVVFTIGDNVSDVFGGAKTFWDKFFADFAGVNLDTKDPFLYWREFCDKKYRPDLVRAIETASSKKEREDGLINCWQGVWQILQSVWVEVSGNKVAKNEETKSEAERKEVLIDQVVKMEELLLRAYSMQLETGEAKQLEEYLNEKNKDGGIDVLPLIYRLQREYLLEDLKKYNTSCYIRPRKDAIEGTQYEFLKEDGVLWYEIINAIAWEGFDREIVSSSAVYKKYVSKDDSEKFDRVIKMLKRWSKSSHQHGLVSSLVLQILRKVKDALIEENQITPDDVNRIAKFHSGDESCDIVECLVYVYLSQRVSKDWPYKRFLTSNAPSNPDWQLGHRLILPLHHDQQRKLTQPFIDSEGKLRKENWGLAEMKISAGYLDQRETSEIGGLSESEKGDIIVPVAMPGVCRNADNPHNCLACSNRNKMSCYTDTNCPLTRHRFHLGYRFQVAKPKDILILIGNDQELLEAARKFSQDGVAFAQQVNTDDGQCDWYRYKLLGSDSDEIVRFNYRYVVLPDCSPKSKQLGDDFVNDVTKVPYWRFGFRRVECSQSIIQLIKTGDVVELRKAVRSAWIKKLAKDCRQIEGRPIKLIVNVDGNENGSERGLVTRKDLLRTMFVECYHTALIAFLKNPPESLELSDTSCHLIALLSLIKVMPDKMVEPQQDYGHGDDYGAKEYIRDQLVAYCDLLKSHLHLSSEFIDALKSIERYVRDADGKGDAIISRKIEDIEKNFEKSIARRLFRGKQDEDDRVRQGCEKLIAFLCRVDKVDLDGWLDAFHGGSDKYKCPSRKEAYLPGRHTFDDNIKAIINACSVPEEDEFNALVESLNSMFLASDVYLRKYEERIATLPEAYKHDGRDKAGRNETKGKSIQQIADYLLGTTCDDTSNANGCMVIKYSRHDRAMPENAIYAEALSGSQSYLNAMSRLVSPIGKDQSGERYADVARLLENAFLRILIIDERVMNFVEERSSDEMKKSFINMGIWIADVVNQGTAEASSEVKDALYQFHHYSEVKQGNHKQSTCVDIQAGQFDVLVIHQGIIDKWWERHDQSKVKEILNDLRLSIPRVVVTTGRGRPENIPEDEKVLPFSVIESSLFRRYPEKPVLVNTIMNLLPYGKQGRAV